jgi:branched-chain amino acid transport system ATP-binding protein
MSVIEATNLRFAYGPVEVLHGINLRVNEGEIVSVIGPNGAGKTTLLNVLAGTHRAASGTITLFGKDVTRASQSTIVRHGLALVPEGRQVFASMTVDDNLTLGAYARRRTVDAAKQRELVFELFPRLADRRGQLAGTLSGGEQQMLAIGRALMSDPRVLLLDEPSLGLAPRVVSLIMRTIGQLRDTGRTIVLVEQNAKAALRLADRGYLLETGVVRTEGPASELADDPRVVAVYLGGGSDAATVPQAGRRNS